MFISENLGAKIEPMDEHNRNLISNVRPQDWMNPEPASIYNLAVIGGGTAGLVSAAGAAGLGAKVALIEKHLLGGDCLNVGCVPSKCMIRSSRAAADVQSAKKFGVNVPDGTEIDFSAVMERMRRLRSGISHHDSAQRFNELGVDVFLGDARFSGPDTVEIADKTIHFKKAVIATGARAMKPDIDGLAESSFLTNETVFNLTEMPGRLACIGGGPIGCELAQAFRRLGCEVTLFHSGSHILNREDDDAAEIIQKTFLKEGIRLILNAKIQRVEEGEDEKVIYYSSVGDKAFVTVDEILAGAGRVPNVEGLNLEAAEVRYDKIKGVFVNDYLQTSNPHIYAAGDICMNWKFTHAADAAARIVIQNALFFKSKKLSSLTMPWCTYTDPEIAHVGLYEREAKEKGIETEIFLRHLKDVDRAVADGEENGFVKVIVRRGTDKIIGATIVARHAGEMISEITLAMVANAGLKTIANVIHPYPTQAESIKQTADLYSRSRLTYRVRKLLGFWLKWTRR